MTANVDNLLHLPEVVRNLGPLWAHSCFPFEAANGKLLNSLHAKCRFTCTRTLFSLREVHENMHAGLPRLHSSITVARFSIITRDLPHE